MANKPVCAFDDEEVSGVSVTAECSPHSLEYHPYVVAVSVRPLAGTIITGWTYGEDGRSLTTNDTPVM